MQRVLTNTELKINQTGNHAGGTGYMVRPRINKLLADAVKSPVITVCAGASCGKTRAVSDFIRQQETPAMWLRFNERDNVCSHFWDSFIGAIANLDKLLADECKGFGFPDTADKLSMFISFMHRSIMNRPCFLVFDDVHLINESAVLTVLERVIHELPPDRKVILICRELPKINMETLQIKGFAPIILEDDLNFNESELTEYLSRQGLSLERSNLREIYADTQGWAFAVNLVARSLKRVPNYSGFVKTTLKQNIFKLIDAESWEPVPERLKRHLIRLSLIDRLSVEMVEILLDRDDGLLSGLKEQNAYIRFDSYGGAYQIHHLFLDFLRTKQDILTDEEKYETYKAAAIWCMQNNFKIDALGYFERIGDYESIILIFAELLEYTTYDSSLYAAGIFERAPAEIFDSVDFFGTVHLYFLLCLGRWQEFFTLAEAYEQKYLGLPEENVIRNHNLCGIYYWLGSARLLMSTTDDRYDFDMYYLKAAEYFVKAPYEQMTSISFGAWVSTVGSARAGAPQKYAEALTRATGSLSNYFSGVIGFDDLCNGELNFYQSDFRVAESLFNRALEQGHKYSQFETIHRALFYLMRIAIIQGDRSKTEQALKDLEALLDEEKYTRRFVTYDIALGWYYCALRQTEAAPHWLKGEFTPYSHAYFIENFGNQIKARYHYFTRDYLPLLSYIEGMRKRESILYGRIEMLAMEACVYFQMKDKGKALEVLRVAYEEASPNDILMPFIELGKDMRTLTMAALREPDCGIPNSWLETIRRKSSSYSKYQSLLISEYKKVNGMKSENDLSHREKEVAYDLYQGLSRSEIAGRRNLTISTVNNVINSIYKKLNAQSIADVVRILSEQKQ